MGNKLILHFFPYVINQNIANMVNLSMSRHSVVVVWNFFLCTRRLHEVYKVNMLTIQGCTKVLWTRIFHMYSHSIGKTRFYFFVKNLTLEKSKSPLILFYFFKRENKTRKKILKKWLHSFWKNMSLKNLNLGPGIRLPIGKVPLKGLNYWLSWGE